MFSEKVLLSGTKVIRDKVTRRIRLNRLNYLCPWLRDLKSYFESAISNKKERLGKNKGKEIMKYRYFMNASREEKVKTFIIR